MPVKRNSINAAPPQWPPRAALPSPPPPCRLAPGVKGRGSGTTIQMQACRPSQVSGSEEKTQEALSPRALW